MWLQGSAWQSAAREGYDERQRNELEGHMRPCGCNSGGLLVGYQYIYPIYYSPGDRACASAASVRDSEGYRPRERRERSKRLHRRRRTQSATASQAHALSAIFGPESSRPRGLPTRQAFRVSRALSTWFDTTTTMSTDAAAVRVELKAFERDFKAKHGKDPSVDDIKSAGMGACHSL